MKLKLLFSVFILASTLFASDELSKQIMVAVTDIMSPINSYSVGSQTITTSSGKTRTFEFEGWTANKGEKSLTRYTKPAAIRGQSFLMLNNADDIWTYFPRTKRVRKLASHAKKQKVQGSDFTYEDMGGGDTFLTQFLSSYAGTEQVNGESCHKIVLLGIPEQDPAYPKMIIYARVLDNYPLRIDYFNDIDFNHKTLILSNVEIIENIPTAMTMVMTDHKERSSTIMNTISITYAWQPTDNFFSERTLKK